MQRLIRLVCLLAAFFAYAANGAQAHIGMAHGETVSVLMCGTGSSERFITLQLGGDGPVETSETCCGDCMVAVALPADPPARLRVPVRVAIPLDAGTAPLVHPRSPLWPGAPPHGPPTALKA